MTIRIQLFTLVSNGMSLNILIASSIEWISLMNFNRLRTRIAATQNIDSSSSPFFLRSKLIAQICCWLCLGQKLPGLKPHNGLLERYLALLFSEMEISASSYSDWSFFEQGVFSASHTKRISEWQFPVKRDKQHTKCKKKTICTKTHPHHPQKEKWMEITNCSYLGNNQLWDPPRHTHQGYLIFEPCFLYLYRVQHPQ